LRQFIVSTRKKFKLKVKGFGDCRPEEIACLTGLGLKEARLAARREYDEPLWFEDPSRIRLFREKGPGSWFETGQGRQILSFNREER